MLCLLLQNSKTTDLRVQILRLSHQPSISIVNLSYSHLALLLGLSVILLFFLSLVIEIASKYHFPIAVSEKQGVRWDWMGV